LCDFRELEEMGMYLEEDQVPEESQRAGRGWGGSGDAACDAQPSSSSNNQS